MSLKDIEKLREKVDKDPRSKLFVPLAEEYRKEGMLDEAVSVLLKGLEGQPGYMSARVSLGKIYLEKGMSAEALSEFENVVKSIPDNLYAHKKLAELYRDTGRKELAIHSYRTVLKLNSMDEEALTSLRELEGPEEAGSTVEPTSFAEPLMPEPSAEEFAVEAEAPVDFGMPEEKTEEYEISAEEGEAEPFGIEEAVAAPGSEEDMADFRNSFLGEAAPAEAEISLEAEAEGEGDMTFGIPAEQPAAEMSEFSFADINEALRGGESHPPETAKEVYAEPAGQFDFGEPVAIGEEPTVPDAAAFVFPETEDTEPVVQRQGPSLEDADRNIAGGNYAGAMNVYSAMLSSNPGDKQVLQRIDELRTLLKLLGKDKEALIMRLNAFLEGVQKRRNEFFGSS